MSVLGMPPRQFVQRLRGWTIDKPSQFLMIVLGIAVIGTAALLISHAATTTVTYSGRLTSRKPSASYGVTPAASGTLTAQASFTKLSSVTIRIVDPNGTTLASQSSITSPVTVSAAAVANTAYSTVVSGVGQGNYTLTITSPIPDDSTPPAISISNPVSGTNVSGVVNVSGISSDNIIVSKVEVTVDAGAYSLATGTTNWNYSLDTAKLTNGSHTISVRATDSSNNTANASASVMVSNAVSDTTAPTAPTGLTATPVSANQINLAWTASSDPDNAGSSLVYDVYQNSGKVATTAAGATTYSSTSLTAGTTYSYYVTARDTAGNSSSPSATVQATTQSPADTTPPSVPTNVTATAAGTSQINLSWTASADPDNAGSTLTYDIYQNSTKIATTVPGTTTYANTALSPATTYTYFIVARDPAGNVSTASVTVQATTASASTDTSWPSYPTSLKAVTASSSQINLSWYASSDTNDAQSTLVYLIYRNSVLVATTAPGVTSYQDTGLLAATTYSYFLKARDPAGNTSGITPSTQATTQSSGPDTTPPKVAITSPTAGETLVTYVSIAGTSSDNVTVSKVDILIDNNLATSVVPSYTGQWSYYYNPLNLTDGSHTITARATDSSGNQNATYITVTVKHATAPPSVSITSPTNGSMLGSMTTVTGTASSDILTFTFTVSGNGISYNLPRSGTTDWSIPFNTIQLPAGTYTLSASVSNGSYSASTSITVTVGVTFNVPTATITSPASGSTLSGTVTISGTASSPVGVSGVYLHIVRKNYNLPRDYPIPVTGTTSWSGTVDTTQIINGAVQISVVVKDKYGYSQIAYINVTIANNTGSGSPTIVVTSPASGSTVSGNVTLTGTASGNSLREVAYFLPSSGANYWIPVAQGVTNWATTINTAYLPNGLQKLTLTASDAASNSQQAVINLNVNNPAPSVGFSSPAASSTVSGVINITGTAADTTSGVDFVLIGVDGDPATFTSRSNWRRVAGTTSWTEPLSTYYLSNGTHTVYAVAYNKAGTPSSYAPLTINVQNASQPTSTTACPSINSAHPMYDQYVSSVNNVKISICSLQNGWTGQSIYNVLRAIGSYPGIPNVDTPGTFGGINIIIADEATLGNGGMGITGNPGGLVTGSWQCSATDIYNCIGHEYGHLWFHGGENLNTANFTGSYPGQAYGYVDSTLSQLERVIGVYGNSAMKAALEAGDGSDSEAEMYKELFACSNSCPEGTNMPPRAESYMNGMPTLRQLPGFVDYITNHWWKT